MVNLGAIAQMVHICRMTGGNPAEIHLSKNTLDEIKAVVKANAKPHPDTRSMLDRMRGAPIPGAIPDGVYLIASLPAVENEEIKYGHVVIRPMEAMTDPDWLQKLNLAQARAQVEAQEKAQAEAQDSTPWFTRQQQPVDPDKVSLASLTGGSERNRPSCSDVLMLAMESADSMEEVIILKVGKGGDVYMTSTLPKLSAQGYIHKTLMKLIGE